jgi:Fur family transcriptional regulator, ferric uptake regulator
MATEDRYDRALERLTAHMRAHGLKLTRQRELILRCFLQAEGHLSVEQLLTLSRGADRGIGPATVYRTMKLFVQAGIAQERRFAEGASLYEADLDGHDDHHDHLICRDCGRILEFENEEIERLQEEVAKRLGFKLTDHRMELFGSCQTVDCEHATA